MSFFSLTPSASGPLYRQVYDRLLGMISSGAYRPGQALPGEHVLCENFGVSRITVRRALDELVKRGVVERRQGAGTFVAHGNGESWRVSLTGVIEDVLPPCDLDVLGEATACPPADVLRLAGLPPGLRMKLYSALSRLDGKRLALMDFYFPRQVALRLSARALSGPVHAIKLVQQMLGTQVSQAEQVVQPVVAGPAIADALELPVGTAVLRIIRVYYDANRRPIEIYDAAFHPTNYRYAATLYPRATPAPAGPAAAGGCPCGRAMSCG